MSIGYYVSFCRKPTDPDYQAKAEAVFALKRAGIVDLPKELADYFGVEHSDGWVPEDSLEVDRYEMGATSWLGPASSPVPIQNVSTLDVAVTPIKDPNYTVIEIDLDNLPSDIRRIYVKVG